MRIIRLRSEIIHDLRIGKTWKVRTLQVFLYFYTCSQMQVRYDSNKSRLCPIAFEGQDRSTADQQDQSTCQEHKRHCIIRGSINGDQFNSCGAKLP
jgi:hypothetical protein